MKVYCYPHTHWDFEWYFTNSESNVQLIYHMNEVFYALENDTIPHYHLDAQLSIVEEYLTNVPENKDRFIKLVQSGKLIIGPWYTQTDELVISGESVIRNLYYGIKTAKKYGDYMKVGYLPDSFGQSKDIPKILNGFGINTFLFWRGLSQDKCPFREFVWKGSDGSAVLSYNIRNGYFFGTNVISQDDTEQVEKTFLHGCDRKIVLLPIGADQRNVDYPFLKRLEYYNKNSAHKVEYLSKTCEEFFVELAKEKDLPIVEGELLDPSYSKIHRSIYSSRYDHKFYNDKIERRLTYQLEPLMVMAKNMGLEMFPNALEEFWKKLLMNHAHDSACGCNSDKTNRTILSRFQSVDESSYSMCDYIVRKLSISDPNSKENDLYIFNTLAMKRSGLFKVILSTKLKGFSLKDQNDQKIPFQVISTEQDYRGSIRKNPKDYDQNLFYYVHKIWIKVDLMPLGVTVLKVIEEDRVDLITPINETMIEDSYYQVNLVKGQISIKNKENSKEHILHIEDSGDDGDTYDYSPPVPDCLEKLDFSNAQIFVTKGDLVQRMLLKGKFSLFQNLEERQSVKGQKSLVPYEFEIFLQNDELIKTKLTLDNTVNDHRMRLVLATNINSKHSIADTLFGTIERDNTPAHLHDWREIGWREEPTPIYPALHFAGVKNSSHMAVAFLKGIKEYEILDDSKIALTLFRSVGFLGKPELIRRPGIASGKEFKYVPTPESQLNKILIFKNAFYLGKKKELHEIKQIWTNYAINPLYYQMQNLNVNYNTLQYFVSNPLLDQTKLIPTMLNSDAIKVEVQSIMPRDKNSFFIRFLNNRPEGYKGGTLTFDKEISWQFVDLKGDILSEKTKSKDIILGDFKIEEIKTILCSFE